MNLPRVVVFGGYGTFGAIVCRELARRGGCELVIVGRDAGRADALARELGPPHAARPADVTDPAACRELLAGAAVAVCCAGPFQEIGSTLLEASLATGSHLVDIADDRSYVHRVRAAGDRWAARGRCAVFGCSSLPGISGGLAALARGDATTAPARSKSVLFIGNDNPKGLAAIRSGVAGLGRPIVAPQGRLRGFGDRERVVLPAPFGARAVYNFDTPDYDLFPALLGVQAVSVKVGFERAAANAAMAALAAVGSGYGDRTARLLARLGGLGGRAGTSGGAVMVELTWADGSWRRASLVAARDSQRMAAMPCVLATRALCAGTTRRGALAPYELLGAAALIDGIAREGFELALDGTAAAGPTAAEARA